MIKRREYELIDKLSLEKLAAQRANKKLDEMRMNSDREKQVIQTSWQRKEDRLQDINDDYKARPLIEFEEVHKYQRGDFPYFYNQAKLTR